MGWKFLKDAPVDRFMRRAEGKPPRKHIYVLSFAFCKKTGRVLLIRKARPAWQEGKLNGVGGKVEDSDKTLPSAARREFREETGVEVKYGWRNFGKLIGEAWVVYLYACVIDNFDEVKATADEPAVPCDPFDLPDDVIPNLRWLVPLAYEVAVVGNDVRANVNYRDMEGRP